MLSKVQLTDPIRVLKSPKYIPNQRLAPPGIDWPDFRLNGDLKRRPLFLLFRSNNLLSESQPNRITILSSIHLFDALQGCRISEEFSLQSKTTGVFRVTDRLQEKDKQLSVNEIQSPCSISSELGSYLEGIYLVIKLYQVARTREPMADSADILLTDSKSADESRKPSKCTDHSDGGSVVLKPYAWTAVDIPALVTRTLEEVNLISRRASSADHRDCQNQRRPEGFRRKESNESPRRPPRSNSVSTDRLTFTSKAEDGGSGRRVHDDNKCTSVASLPTWRSPKDESKNSTEFIELNVQASSRIFIKMEPTTGNLAIERTIIEASKLKSSMNCLSPWVHELPIQVVHGHSNRRVRTVNSPIEIAISGQIVSPYGLFRHLQIADFYSTEGKPLLTQNHSEMRLQEIVEFPTVERIFPFNFPRNLLYIYPLSVNFGTLRSTPKNLEVLVQLWCSDSVKSYIIPAFPGSTPSNGLHTETRIHVISKNRSPEFTHEIKVILPKELTSKHYLLFTFLHVSFASGCIVEESIRGYSRLPILSKGVLCAGEESLCIYEDCPTPETFHIVSRASEVPKTDPIKNAFHLRLAPFSSLYQDDTDSLIVRDCDKQAINEIVSSLNELDLLGNQADVENTPAASPILARLQKAQLDQLIRCMAPIMDELLQILGASLVQDMMKSSQNAFTLLAFYLHRISEGLSNWKEELTGRNHFLCAYLSGIGDCKKECALTYLLSGYPLLGLAWTEDISLTFGEDKEKKLHEKLLECLLAQIGTNSPFFRFFYEDTLWFFLELLVRTLMEECKNTAETTSKTLVENLYRLTREVTKDLSQRVLNEDNEESFSKACLINRAIAFFLQDLISCINASHVFQFIRSYVQEINDSIEGLLPPKADSTEDCLITSSNAEKIRNLELLKLEMIQIVTAAPEYLALSLPDPSRLPADVNLINKAEYFCACKSSSEILTDLTYQRLHFLPALLLSEIYTCLLKADPVLTENALEILYSLMSIHELEDLSTDVCTEGALYLPFLNIACSHAAVMYNKWFHNLKKRKRVSREVEKEAALLESPKNGSGDAGVTKRSGWIFSSISAKERVKRIGRRNSTIAERRTAADEQTAITVRQGRSTSKTALKAWIYPLIPPSSFLISNETNCPFNEHITKLILLQMLWVLKKTRHEILKCWFANTDIQTARSIIALLVMALGYFEYSDEFDTSEESIRDSPKDFSKTGNPGLARSIRTNSMETSDAKFTKERERTKLLYFFVTSTMCRTLDLIVEVYCKLPTDDENAEIGGEKAPSVSRLIGNVARAYIFGLSMHQCAKTFRLLCCGVCNLISKFPTYFLVDEAAVTTFNLCRVLLSHTISPLSKIREIVNAALFCIFQLNHKTRGHLYHINGYMILALHTYLAPSDLSPELFSSPSWLLRRLDIINDCLGEYSESSTTPVYWTRLLSLLIHDRRVVQGNSEENSLSSSLTSMDGQLLMARSYLPTCFNTLKMYAAGKSKIPQETKRNEPINALRFVLDFVNQQAPEAGIYGQINATVHDLQKVLAGLLRLSDLRGNFLGSHIVDKENQHSIVEVLVELASACRLVPELRQYWLLRLAEVHLLFKQPAEAAQALLHTLAIDIEQILSRKNASFIDFSEGVDSMARQLMSPNILEESALEHAVGLPVPFTISGEHSHQKMTTEAVIKRFSELIEKIAKCFCLAEQFEQIPPLCEWIMPALYSTREHDCLIRLNKLTEESLSVTNPESNKSHRLFSTYFRVGFYGRFFGDEDGKEFIYKQAPLTKLSEMTARLQKHYSRQLGGKSVEIIKDSNQVVAENLSKTAGYLQITYVEPYFEEYELRKRKLESERNYGINRFVMVTPFTQNGLAHGNISEQYKRKVILTVPRTFPYLNTRLPIIAREELVLSPIEVALEDVARRNQQLSVAIHADPPDPKFLQMVVQGCVSTTVNQGPLEVATAFLSKRNSPADTEDNSGNSADYFDGNQNDLRLCLKEFLRISQEAVRLSRQLIEQDQEEYQRALERNFIQIKLQMEPFLTPPRSYDDLISVSTLF
ncbi:hypothetical protein Aperf_G00000042064 [Anoplocephala perfoliata]